LITYPEGFEYEGVKDDALDLINLNDLAGLAKFMAKETTQRYLPLYLKERIKEILKSK